MGLVSFLSPRSPGDHPEPLVPHDGEGEKVDDGRLPVKVREVFS